MGTNVFANNNEIVSKGAEGKSVAAFPDVCWTPPAPPVGPIPLPYPNSTEDKDLDNGTTTVQIKDKTVCMGDTSYIAKSKGDEAATQSQPKNLLTSTIQGKGYFVTSSQDVKVEGKGATRHLDMMTHNHASPAGTPPQGEVSTTGSNSSPEGSEPGSTKIVEKELIAVAIRRDNIADAKNSDKNSVYYVSDETQMNAVKKFYTDNSIPQEEQDEIRVIGNEKIIQFVNLTPEYIDNYYDKSNKKYKIHLPATANSQDDLISSTSMVGKRIKIKIYFRGSANPSYFVDVTIQKKASSLFYTPNEEKRDTRCRYGFLDHTSKAVEKHREKGVTKEFPVGAHNNIDIELQLDAATPSEYTVSVQGKIKKDGKVEQTKNTIVSLPVATWKKIFVRLFTIHSDPSEQLGKTALQDISKEFKNCGIDIELFGHYNIGVNRTLAMPSTILSTKTVNPITQKPDTILYEFKKEDYLFKGDEMYKNEDLFNDNLDNFLDKLAAKKPKVESMVNIVFNKTSLFTEKKQVTLQCIRFWPEEKGQSSCVVADPFQEFSPVTEEITNMNWFIEAVPVSGFVKGTKFTQAQFVPNVGELKFTNLLVIVPNNCIVDTNKQASILLTFNNFSASGGFSRKNTIVVGCNKLFEKERNTYLSIKKDGNQEILHPQALINEITMHELGHWMGVVPCPKTIATSSDPANTTRPSCGRNPTKFPCPNYYTTKSIEEICPYHTLILNKGVYDRTANFKNICTLLDGYDTWYIHRGHSGPHCNFGVGDSVKLKNGEFGEYTISNVEKAKCIMFGQIRVYDVKPSLERIFCDCCKNAIQKSLCISLTD